MKQKTITVEIKPDNKVSIEVDGVQDAQCLKETEALEKMLGTVLNRHKKPEAYRVSKGGTKVTVGGK